MTQSYSLIRKEEPPPASVCLRLLSASLLGLALAGAAFAQRTETRITTLLPSSLACQEQDPSGTWKVVEQKSTLGVSDVFPGNKKSACYLEFSVASIPADGTITDAVLRLVQSGDQPNPSALVINVASIPRGDWTKSLADYEDNKKDFHLGRIRSSKTGKDAVDTWSGGSGSLLRSEADKKYIALLLSPAQSRSGRNYYPATGDTTNNASNQPRLILTYTVPRSSTLGSQDSQSDGWVAMRSPRPFMPDPNVPAQDNYAVRQAVDGTKISSYNAAMYGGLTYVVRTYANTQNNTSDWRLDAQDPFGNVVWTRPLPAALGQKARVIVNGSGRLTIVSQTRFIVYQLNTAGPPQQLKDIPAVSGTKSPAALLSAPDGSLYVIDETDLYALNPDLQMLWRTGIGTSAKARMTLSPDGQFVYATGIWPGDGGTKTTGMLAINAQTGKTPTKFLFPPETTTFHNPVVIKHPGGADYIYLAANSQDSGVLRTVKNVPSGVSGDRVAEISPVKEEKGLFSQPAPDATAPPQSGDLKSKKLYVVWKQAQSSPARLVSINGQSGAIEHRDTAPQLNVVDASALWSGGNLAMDTKGSVFFWENGTLYGYAAGASQLFARNIAGLPSNLELLFGSDGTLYAQDSNNGALSALIPSYQLPTPSDSISSPTHLRVDGNVNKDTTLSASGSVFLGNGFTVKQGATLTIKTKP